MKCSVTEAETGSKTCPSVKAGDSFGLGTPKDASVHFGGNPMSHSTQYGFSAAFSERGCSCRIT